MTKTITLYTFDELKPEAQQKALQKFSDINVDYDWWTPIYEGAEEDGIKITSFDLDRNLHATGEFTQRPEEVAKLILDNHGTTTDTYKIAARYSGETDTETFLNELLPCYAKMLQNESEYLQSGEAIKETILANEYYFNKDGKKE